MERVALISQVLKAARRGTLLRSTMRRFGWMPVEDRVRWLGAGSVDDAARALAVRGKTATLDGGCAIVVGSDDGFQAEVERRLKRLGVSYKSVSSESLKSLSRDTLQSAKIVLSALSNARSQTQLAGLVANHEILGCLPFEHASGLDSSGGVFKQLDEYAQTQFVSPVLLDEPTPHQLYAESLALFEQKCGLRDFLDLYQLIKSVVENDVEGDIVEFGSYRGHSGWLIARTLRALGSSKRLYLFDTFQSFPNESHGVDHFWSSTHTVDYEQVKSKFKDLPFVSLVKGDFTKTLPKSPVRKVALAYIDCDSYRATRYLLKELPDGYMSPNSIMICEDYGHPALLGNRLAVHEVSDGASDWFRFFSQFSGLYVMVDLGRRKDA